MAWVSSCTSHILFLCKNWDIFATFVHVDLIRVFLFLFRHCTKRTKVFHKGSPVNDTSYIFARRSHCIRLCWVHRRLFDFLSLIIYFPSLWNIYDKSPLVTLPFWIKVDDILKLWLPFCACDYFCSVFIWVSRRTMTDVDIYSY